MSTASASPATQGSGKGFKIILVLIVLIGVAFLIKWGLDQPPGITFAPYGDPYASKTDFAQVEVDEQQVNLTRFDLFFPEKRPFFLENAGTFDFGTPQETEIFFSRRIGIDPSGAQVPIDAGVRVSG